MRVKTKSLVPFARTPYLSYKVSRWGGPSYWEAPSQRRRGTIKIPLDLKAILPIVKCFEWDLKQHKTIQSVQHFLPLLFKKKFPKYTILKNLDESLWVVRLSVVFFRLMTFIFVDYENFSFDVLSNFLFAVIIKYYI